MKKPSTRSTSARAFIISVAADCLQEDYRSNPKLISDMRTIAAEMKVDGRGQSSLEDQRRIDRQRTMFNMLSQFGGHKDKLRAAMMQRAYDLMWDGDTSGCDALLEFLPSEDAQAVLDAWEIDVDPKADEATKSRWYRREAA